VVRAATHGDRESIEFLTASAQLVGQALASIVNFFNPSLILLGGEVAGAGDLYLATIRQKILGQSPPLATRDLSVALSTLYTSAGLIGCAAMVLDELLLC
jgi:predicted NBD/HSP70 family sugar kinase